MTVKSTLICPRCSEESTGQPYRYQTKGYARCPYCGAGIKYISNLFRTDLQAVSWYVPDGCTVSPKTNRILCGHRVHKSGRFLSYIFKRMVGHPNPNGQARRKGTLRNSLTKNT